ncbi:DUF3168 domain-containing protein [Paraburkholderia sp. Tr-20389]|uniref:tail completion protein gp17 n=1 Tax=Paraburkholderia sp. Tr-20389 TaxID=2703903 RepID=UPI00197DD3F4|nr:DUF3168 domain-containing protein [Paraburkholderia sp. Tr-20389]MBN3756067.1 DUF3168 domain-containing protein [Paraburkholderia sp. Tr-20389]
MTGDELFALLDQALPGRVFKALAPQGTAEPYVIYALTSGMPRNTMCGNAHCTQMSYRVDSYAKTQRDAFAAIDAIGVLVDACEGDPLIENRQDMYEQDTRIHRVSVVLSTWQLDDEVLK